MATEKINQKKKVVIFELSDYIAIKKENGNGSALVKGQEVYLKSDSTCAVRSTATNVLLGTVDIGADDGDNVVVKTNFIEMLKGVASGTLAVGSFVKQTGTVVDGQPQYVAGVAGDLCYAIVTDGAADGGEIEVGVMHSPKLVS